MPWALFVTRLFRQRKFEELPQRVAQHNLLFTALQVGSLADPLFLGRVLLGCLFFLGGINNVMMWTYNSAMVRMKVGNVLGLELSPGAAALALGVATALQVSSSSARD